MNPADRLVVAYNFPPFVDASAITTVKRIVSRGEFVDVVSNDLVGVRRVDESLTRLVEPFIRHHLTVRATTSFAQWSSMRDFTFAGVAALRRAGLSRHRVVYSRSMWAQSHFLAAALKGTGAALEWVAEFSDPLRRTVEGGRRLSGAVARDSLAGLYLAAAPQLARRALEEAGDVFDWAELLPLALADEIIFTNENQRDVVLDGLASSWLRARTRDRGVIRPHPSIQWDIDPADHRVLDRVGATVHLGYFGTFYPNRGLGALLEALQRVTSEGVRVMLDVYSDPSPTVEEAVRAAGVTGSVRLRAPVPYATGFSLQRQYDGLVVNDAFAPAYAGRQPFLPSKLSDYRAADVPIIAIVEPGSPTAGMGLKYQSRIGDVGDLVATIRKLVDDVQRD